MFYKDKLSLNIRDTGRVVSRWYRWDLRMAFFANYLIFFLLTSLCLTPVVLMLLGQSSRQHREVARRSVSSKLHYIESELIDVHSQIKNLQASINKVSTLSDLREASHIYQLHTQQELIRKVLMKSDFVKDIRLFYANNYLVTSKYTFTDANWFDDFYPENTNEYGLPKSRYIKETLSKTYGIPAGTADRLTDQLDPQLEFYIPVRDGPEQTSASMILVLDLQNVVDQLTIQQVKDVSIFDKRLNMLFSNASDKERAKDAIYQGVEGVDYFGVDLFDLNFAYRLKDVSLTYHLGTDPKEIYIYTSIIFLLVFLLSLGVSKYQSKPIIDLYNSIEPTESRVRVCYKDLQNVIENRIERYESSLRSLEKKLDSRTFELFLRGVSFDKQSIQFETLDHSWPGTCFRVLVFSIVVDQGCYTSPIELLKDVLVDFFSDSFNQELFIHDYPVNHCLVILPTSISVNEIHEKLSSFMNHVLEVYDLKIKVLVSAEYNHKSEVKGLHAHLEEYLNTHNESRNRIIMLDHETPYSGDALASNHTLNQIRHQLLEGNGEVVDLIDQTWSEASPQTLSARLQIFFALKNAIDNTKAILSPKKQPGFNFSYVDVVEDPNQAVEVLKEYAIQIISSVRLDRKESFNPMLDHIRMYIDDNYKNSELYGKAIADQFKISEKYFYSSFKKTIGVSFNEYLNSRRLEEAQKLLASTTYTLTVIAQKVGYNSQDTFSKAFKRKYALTPGQYRRMQTISTLTEVH